MIGRILRTELRRSIALVLALVTVAILLLLLHMGNSPSLKGMDAWTRQWNSLARWERFWVMSVCPIVLGLGALQGRADHRAKMDELLSTTPRPVWRRAGPKVAAVAIALSAAYLLVMAASAVQVAGNATYLDLAWLPVTLVALLGLVTSAVLGLGIGRLVPSLLTAPVLAIAGLVGLTLLDVQSFTATDETPLLLAPELHEPTDAFTTVAASVHLGQAVWFLGLAITGYLLFVVRRWRARLVAFAPAALGLVVALVVLPGTAAAAYPTDRAATALVCADGAPKVCVTAANADELPYLVGPARQALAELSALPNAPTEAVEADPAPETDPAAVGEIDPSLPVVRPVDWSAKALVVDFNDLTLEDYTTSNSLRHDPATLRLALLAGAGTPPCPSATPEHADRQAAARAIAAAWVTGTLRNVDESRRVWAEGVGSLADQVWHRFRALPAATQKARIVALRSAALTCRGDLLSILTTGSAG